MPGGCGTAQFDTRMGELYLEVFFSDLDGSLAWSYVARRDGKVVGSLGGVQKRVWRIDDKKLVQLALEDAVRKRLPFSSIKPVCGIHCQAEPATTGISAPRQRDDWFWPRSFGSALARINMDPVMRMPARLSLCL